MYFSPALFQLLEILCLTFSRGNKAPSWTMMSVLLPKLTANTWGPRETQFCNTGFSLSEEQDFSSALCHIPKQGLTARPWQNCHERLCNSGLKLSSCLSSFYFPLRISKKIIGSVLIRAQTQGKVLLYPRLISWICSQHRAAETQVGEAGFISPRATALPRYIRQLISSSIFLKVCNSRNRMLRVGPIYFHCNLKTT